ncbi:MAG: hypothetical protein M3Q06_02025, partial [Bacteroidota bacterium]|nr:hypothetical protein [Bacteroidota bacterium]
MFTMLNKFVALCTLQFMVLAGIAQTIKSPAPYGALPSKSQVQWQKLEYYMFIHFGPNTFTDK